MATKTTPWKVGPRGAKSDACKQHMLVAGGSTICPLVLKDGTRVEPRKYEGGWHSGTGRGPDWGPRSATITIPAAT